MGNLIFSDKDILILADLLNNNEVICVPTDTVYGLCAKTNSYLAYKNLVNIKDRPNNKLFPIMCSDLNQIREIALINDKTEELIKKYMPGPLTVILKIKDNPKNYINLDQDTIAVRLATSPTLKRLIQQIDCPLFMTSANKSGYSPCKNIDEVLKNFSNLKGVLAGNVTYSIPSTIVDCVGDDFKILREGPITVDDINNI